MNRILPAALLASALAASMQARAKENIVVEQATRAAAQLPDEGRFPSLAGATGWLDSQPLTAADLGKEAAVVHSANGRIVYRFHARDLNLVMGPEIRGSSVRFRVRTRARKPSISASADPRWPAGSTSQLSCGLT
jgi:hypothetical protein